MNNIIYNNDRNLIFFDKDGNQLNIFFDESTKKYTSKLYFDENSDDTFRTYGLYVFEKIPEFTYQNNDGVSEDFIKTKRLQVFNENNIEFKGNNGNSALYNIDKIYSTNTSNLHYTKWVQIKNIEKNIEVSDFIIFDTDFLDIIKNTPYTVVDKKKDAILILTSTNNFDFNITYQNDLSNSTFFNNKNVSVLNAIVVHDYTNLSSWNDIGFESNIVDSDMLSISNDKNNTGVYKVSSTISRAITTYNTFNYNIDNIKGKNIIYDITFKTNTPIIYDGDITISNNNIILSSYVNSEIRGGVKIRITNSIQNQDEYTISEIPLFDKYKNSYSSNDLVIFNSKIYRCVIGYTQDTSLSISPKNKTYWEQSYQFKVNETLTNESILSSQIIVSSDKISFTYNSAYDNSYTTSALSISEYTDSLSAFGINTYIKNNTVHIQNEVSEDTLGLSVYNDITETFTGVTSSGSLYNTNITLGNTPYKSIKVFVNNVEYRFGESTSSDCFFSDNNGSTALPLNNITTTSKLIWNVNKSGKSLTASDIINITYYRIVSTPSSITSYLIPVENNLTRSINKNISNLQNITLEILDLDSYGLDINLNGLSYYISTEFVYFGNEVNLQQTINNTILNWYYKYHTKINQLGISAKVKFINDIAVGLIFKSMFPNIQFDLYVNVGSTANYLFLDKKAIIKQTSNTTFSANINGRNYSVKSTKNDVQKTLIDFVSLHYATLVNYDIYIKAVSNTLYFYKKNQKSNISVTINNGINDVVGYETKSIVGDYIKYNEPTVLTCNKLINTNSVSFEDYGFSTGQVLSINNSPNKLNNKEYNVVNLNPSEITLSYQGIYFDNPISNTYSNAFTYSSLDVSNTDRILKNDIIEENGIVANLVTNVNETRLDIYDINKKLIKKLILDDLTSSMFYNSVNKCIYLLSNTLIAIFDTNTLDIVKTLTPNVSLGNIKNGCYDINGYVYISHQSGYVSIYNNLHSFVTATQYYNTEVKVVYNSLYDEVYVFNSSNLTKSYVKIAKNGTYNSSFNNYIPNIVMDSIYIDSTNGIIYLISNNSPSYNLYTIINDVSTQTTITGSSDVIYYCTNLLNASTYISYPSGSGDLHVSNKFGVNSFTINTDGKLYYNPNDSFIYMSDSDTSIISVISSIYNNVVYSTDIGYTLDNMFIYDSGNRIFGFDFFNYVWLDMNFEFLLNDEYLQKSDMYLIMNSDTSSTLSSSINIQEPTYGALDSNYVDNGFILLSVRTYLRFPRENYEGKDNKVKYVWSWEINDSNDMFLYDISGNQLKNNGKLTYIGEKPLSNPKLNFDDNRDISKISDPSSQKTVFSEIVYELEYIDSTTDITFEPEPMQVFVGFKSDTEGVFNKKLVLKKLEDSTFTLGNNDKIEFIYDSDNNINKIKLTSVGINLSDYFKSEQLISININDNTRIYNKYVSKNNGKKFTIDKVYYDEIFLIAIDENLTNEVFDDTNIDINLNVEPKIIAEFNMYGQTEIEDIRYRIELSNTGKLVNLNDTYIFEEYDINEGGVDWMFLNKKRKEMLMVRNDIYNYIGSYKAIINAINYFGYNDLELYEYLKNINVDDPLYDRLIKIRIPDIFNNEVKGWTEESYYSNIFNDSNYESTNLFNLTYNITDEDGNNITLYSLEEVIIKLVGLKKWLMNNVIPITHKIKDITGVTTTKDVTYIAHNSSLLKKIENNDTLSTVVANINEVNKLPIESGSNVFNVVIEPKDYGVDYDYYNINIRTYKIYDAWDVFKEYVKDDIVYYRGAHYIANIDNKNVNPISSINLPQWDSNAKYNIGDRVKYLDKYYIKTYYNTNNDYVYLNNGVGYETDLLNTLLNNKPSYFSVPSNEYYAGLDILESMNMFFTGSTTINNFTYSGIWNTSSQAITPYSLPPANIYRVGYNSVSSISSSSNIGYGSASYSLSIDSTPNPTTSTNLNSYTALLTNNNVLTPNLVCSFETNNLYYFRINNISFNNLSTTLYIMMEISPNNYITIGTIDSSSSGTIDIPFSISNYTRPKFAITQYTNVTSNSGAYVPFNGTVTFDYYILSSDGITADEVKSNPELLNSNKQLQDDLANYYFTNSSFNISNIAPSSLDVAKTYVSNMVQNFIANKNAYKEKYNTMTPLQNVLQTNKDFVIWADTTYWSEIDLKPVQFFTEYRDKGDTKPYNITIDSAIDPYVKVDVITDNGYGMIYKYTKNYDIRYNADR